MLRLLLLLFLLLPSTRGAQEERQELLEVLQGSLLKLLGMHERPIRKRSATPVPDYMMQLYKRQKKLLYVDDTEQVLDTELPFTTAAVDTVRSHLKIETGDEDLYGGYRSRLRFNVSDHTEKLLGAQVRLFYQGEMCGGSSSQLIQMYDVLRPATKKHGEAVLRLLDSRSLDSNSRGWVSLDVYPAVQRWLSGDKNYGLYVQVSPHLLSNSSVEHVCLRRSGCLNWDKYQPLLITLGGGHSALANPRQRRSTAKKPKKRARRDNCKRHPLYIDFTEVGWNDWIVAPPGYHAYYCHGECPFPLAQHLNSTNHAVVQTLINSMNSVAVPRACCVPTELRPISMLYTDAYDRVVLKNYQDMAVEGCGCR